MNVERDTATRPLLHRLPLITHAWLFTLAFALGLASLLSIGVSVPSPSALMLGIVVITASLGPTRSGLFAGLTGGFFEIFVWLSEPAATAGGLARAMPGMLLAVSLGPYIGFLRERIERSSDDTYGTRTRSLEAGAAATRPQVSETQELDLVRERLVTSQDRLRDVTKRWIDAQESERRKLARQLHDDIGQSLTALRINLESNKNRFASDEAARQFIESAYELVDRIIASVRELSLSLRPSLLDDFGLGAALREHVCQQLKRAGIQCKLRISGDDRRLDETLAVAVYRIIQEYMAGIQQRAQTDTVAVDVDFGAERLEISIREKGVGERDEDAIASVRERAVLIGGTLDVRDSRGGDARLDFSIPCPPASGEEAVS